MHTTTVRRPQTKRRSGLDRDYCWFESGGHRCLERAWGGTLVCREHMRQGMRRFIAARGVSGEELERRVDAAMRNLDAAETVRVAQVSDPGRLRF